MSTQATDAPRTTARYWYYGTGGRMYFPEFREVGRWGSPRGRFRVMKGVPDAEATHGPLYALVCNDDDEPSVIFTEREARYFALAIARTS